MQVADGQRVLHQALTWTWDVMVIDRGLPILDGVRLIPLFEPGSRPS